MPKEATFYTVSVLDVTIRTKELRRSWQSYHSSIQKFEDEVYVLRTCPLYQDLRDRLSPQVKNSLFTRMDLLFTDTKILKEMSKFLGKINKRRFSIKTERQKEPLNC